LLAGHNFSKNFQDKVNPKAKKSFSIFMFYFIAQSVFVLFCRARRALSKCMLDLVTTNLVRGQRPSKAF
jgi:hypothetical protein